jgi:hypothetical protein
MESPVPSILKISFDAIPWEEVIEVVKLSGLPLAIDAFKLLTPANITHCPRNI